MRLTSQQVNFFRQSGYFKLPGRLSPHTVSLLREAIQNIIDNRIEPVTCDDAGRVIRIPQLINRAPVFLETITSPDIIEPLESLLGPNIEALLNRHNHATVNFKSPVEPRLHRDVLQWTRSIITLIVYLEDATIQNGCTEVIPGSHLLPFVGTPNNGGTWMDEHSVYADMIDQAVPIPLPAGSILILDGLVFHRVGKNHTDGTRMSFALGFHSVDELSSPEGDRHRVLIKGERLYKGNDRDLE